MRAHTIKNILFTPPNLKNDLKLDLFPRKMDIQHPTDRRESTSRQYIGPRKRLGQVNSGESLARQE